MTTSAFITLLVEEFGTSWTRPKLLEVANRAQNEIMGKNSTLTRVKPDPFLTTEDVTYSYVASDSLFLSDDGTKGASAGDIRSVVDAYTFDRSISFFDFQTLDPQSSRPYQFEQRPTNDKVTARYDIIPSIEPNSSDCLLKWWEENNPGDTTITWRATAYRWPNQLLTENVALSIPADFQDTLLLLGIKRRIQRRDFGRSDREDYDVYLKKFWTRYKDTPRQALQICLPRAV